MAPETSFVQHAIPLFDGHTDHWSMLLENFLCSKEHWHIMGNGVPVVAEGATLTKA